MKIKLWPDKDIHVHKIRIGPVPTLVLRPANRPSIPVSVLWIQGIRCEQGNHTLAME